MKDTIKEILREGKEPTLYASVVLDDNSRKELLNKVAHMIPEGWKVIGHHMTIYYGKESIIKNEVPELIVKVSKDIGKTINNLKVTKIGISDMAMAVEIEGYPSKNETPHITIAVNEAEGGKPVMSNTIKHWVGYGGDLNLSGKVVEKIFN